MEQVLTVEEPAEELPVPGPEEMRQAGRFVYHLATEAWDWDDDVFAIHGYKPGEVTPTTELILQHKHEQDRDLVDRTLREAMAHGDPFNIYYRMVVGDSERRVVLVGQGERDEGKPADAPIDRLVGYYVDLTEELEEENNAAADAAVAASAAGRDTIEQAKGILMLGYGLDPNAAFAMLKWWSRNRNMKVREVAERLIQVAREGHISHPGLRRLLDALLDDLTVRHVD